MLAVKLEVRHLPVGGQTDGEKEKAGRRSVKGGHGMIARGQAE